MTIDWTKVNELMATASVPITATGGAHSSGALFTAGKHAFPGAVLLVGQGGEVLYQRAFGSRSLIPVPTAMQEDTVFDLSSLTKVIVTTTLLMRLVDHGQLTVDRKLSRIFQSFGTFGKEQITIQHLLTHSAGFPAVIPFYKEIAKLDSGPRAGLLASRGAVEFVYNDIFRSHLEYAPGQKSIYSDVGFILLGDVAEVINGGKQLDRLAHEQIFAPLKLFSTGYIDLSKLKRRGLAPDTGMIAPTAECHWRKRLLWGEVHDDNAWAMGGVAGHAGVFSTAFDLYAFARELIECYHGRGQLLSRDIVRQFWTRDSTVSGSSWALGWDTPSASGSSCGKYFSSAAVGHLGFTGCSVWIDPERELAVVLLSNRIHPSPENTSIREFRPMIHDRVMEALGLA